MPVNSTRSFSLVENTTFRSAKPSRYEFADRGEASGILKGIIVDDQ